MITKILYDYNLSNDALSMKDRTRKFIEDNWKDYISFFSLQSLEKDMQEAVAKVLLAKVIQHRFFIEKIRKGVAL